MKAESSRNKCRYQLQSTELEIYEKLAAIWHQGVDLQENLDTLEPYDFVYGLICLHIDGADFDSFPCWAEEDWLEPDSRGDRGE